ncbi:ATP-binding protein [Amycolatopsis sp. lyj-23]|uniref:ATP-binding protein n=1 Tax=Amycolatopsis sp. lyj-23 TaxID=2789283 RepID=UPI003978EEE7
MSGAWPFVGRQDELRALTRDLEDGAPGFVLTGPAGVGKSRLVSEVCTALDPARCRTRIIRATEADPVPFGAFASALPSGTTAVSPRLPRIHDRLDSIFFGHGDSSAYLRRRT